VGRIVPRLARTILCALVLAVPVACTKAVALPDYCGSIANCLGSGIPGLEKSVLHEQAGCVWLTDAGHEYPVLWPPYYTAYFGPLIVMNRVGWHVAVEGSILRYHVTPSDLVDPCGRTPWVAVDLPEP
jgi:hypothetical protein